MTSRDWTAYTEALQQLADIRRQHATADAQRSNTLRQAQAKLEALTQQLGAQRNRLQTLAPLLKLNPPYLDHIQPATTVDLGQALAHAANATEQADTQARNAETLASRPPLLPAASPAGRAALVYAGWCLIAWLAQCALALFSGTDVSAVLWSICGLPALAFFAGFLTLHLFGQPRIGGQIPYSLRMGGVICFLGMPILWALLMLAFIFIRT